MSECTKYNCPNCSASLFFRSDDQKMHCTYCSSTFELEEIQTEREPAFWSNEEREQLRNFSCSSCGGDLITDENTVSTFCPYCGNATIIPGRVSDCQKPDSLIPFKKNKDDAKESFLAFCKGKYLLPKDFKSRNQIEKITGIYVPFWLCSCSADLKGTYCAKKERNWSDEDYEYTETEYYTLKRAARADFHMIPIDASKKMDDAIMESIEPYDYTQLETFNTLYLSGYFTDKYDVPIKECKARLRQRVYQSLDHNIRNSCNHFTSVYAPETDLTTKNLEHKYVLLPVWILQTRYKEKLYTFAMNGQTGKITGSLPISRIRVVLWFFLIFTLLSLPLFAFFSFVGLIFAGVFSILSITSMKKNANTAVLQEDAESYLNTSSYELYEREDVFLRAETSQKAKEKDSGNKRN